jgi:excisionase family DNA binding protein
MQRTTFTTTETPESGLVTKPELAKIARVSTRTIDNWIKKKVVPYLKIGRLVRFDARRCLTALSRFEKHEVR